MPRMRFVLCGIAVAMLAFGSFRLWPRRKTNVLLITLDTTRADRLGCYGYPRARTPNLDHLAASGVLCERAWTVAPLTLPAHTSLFTGLYPAENGVRSNGRGRLDDSIPTLAEVLKRNGYETAAFVASFVLNSQFGLNQGFRTYDDEISEKDSTDDRQHRERNGEVVVDAALAWLQEQRSRPFFCWVHLFDPHAPYLAHTEMFGGEFAARPYDGEIAYVDRQVGRLVDYLKKSGLESETLVVVVGDHGEGLGEHLERKHGMTLYNATMRVPLIFRQSGRFVPGRRIAGNVSMVDVSPTILDALALRDTRKITGKSIKAGLLGGEFLPSLCFGANDEPFLSNGWCPLRSLVDGSWKYIKTTRPELYDLATDPGEMHNLAESDPGRRREMESRLGEFESRLVLRAGAAVQLTRAERRALEAFGYLVGSQSSEAALAPADLPDVKDMLRFEAAVDDAPDLIREKKTDAAIDLLRDVISHSPGHSKASLILADTLRNQSKFDEAEDVLRALLKFKPDFTEGHYQLALVALAQGRDDAAVLEFQEALATDPDFAEAHYELAMIHVRRQEVEEALDEFNKVLEIDHCHGGAYCERGTLLVTQGRVAEAVADFRTGLKYAPDDPLLHHNLALVLGGSDESVRHLERAIELSPDNAEFHYSLGSLLLGRRQYAEAVRELQIAVELKPDHPVARNRLQEALDLSQMSRP